MTPLDQLIQFYEDRLLPTSSRDTTGKSFAEVNARLAIAQYGTAERALEELRKIDKTTNK